MKTFLLILIASSCFINSCTLQVKTDNNASTGSSDSKIRNGIQIQENGLHADQAYLMLDDG